MEAGKEELKEELVAKVEEEVKDQLNQTVERVKQNITRRLTGTAYGISGAIQTGPIAYINASEGGSFKDGDHITVLGENGTLAGNLVVANGELFFNETFSLTDEEGKKVLTMTREETSGLGTLEMRSFPGQKLVEFYDQDGLRCELVYISVMGYSYYKDICLNPDQLLDCEKTEKMIWCRDG